MKSPSISQCQLIALPKIQDGRGCLSFVEQGSQIPFEPSRFFYLYEMPEGSVRGGHAHKQCHQFIIGMAGAFDLEIDDGKNKQTIHLSDPATGMHVPPGIWCNLSHFSESSIVAVLASDKYDESDYLRDYDSFLQYKELAQ